MDKNKIEISQPFLFNKIVKGDIEELKKFKVLDIKVIYKIKLKIIYLKVKYILY